MSEPNPLEEDLKLVKYRNSYWIVLEPEGIPLVEFARTAPRYARRAALPVDEDPPLA